MVRSRLRVKYLFAMSGFSLLILMIFISYHQVTTHYARRNAEENMAFVISQINSKLEVYFSELDAVVNTIAANTTIQSFLMEDSALRYNGSFGISGLVDSISATSSHSSGVILYDNENSLYRYNLPFSIQSCRSLHSIYKQEVHLTTYGVSQVENQRYFCVSLPIYNFSVSTGVRVGQVLVLSNLAHMQNMLYEFNSFSNMVIHIQFGDSIIASNKDTEMEQWNYEGNYSLQSTPFSNGCSLAVYMDSSDIFPYESIFFFSLIIVLLAFVVLTVLSLMIAGRMIVNPVSRLINNLQNIGNNSLKQRLPPLRNPELNQLTENINLLLDRIEDYSRRSFATQQKLYETELLKREVELKALHRQINAHFLFNTLNTIQALSEEGGQEDVAVIAEGLATLMRYSYLQDEYINVFDELQIVEKYIYIMNVRYKNKFTVVYDVDDELCEYKILKQLLQPLVENSMIHGLEKKQTDCLLKIMGKIDPQQGYLTFAIEDNGVGMTAERLAQIQEKLDRGVMDFSLSGVALANINQRIRLYHGSSYGLSIWSEENKGCKVTFTFPLLPDE